MLCNHFWTLGHFVRGILYSYCNHNIITIYLNCWSYMLLEHPGHTYGETGGSGRVVDDGEWIFIALVSWSRAGGEREGKQRGVHVHF
jgi:hypothetical protein